MKRPALSLRALLEGAVDYAGLFPPASLTLEPALRNHAEYVRSPEAWMLGAFILPVGKFEEASALLGPFDVEHRLRVSALGPATENANAFIETLGALNQTIEGFNTRHGATAAVVQLEMPLPATDGASLAETNRALSGLELPTYWERAADEAERTVGFIAERHTTGAARYGFKLRTGGVVASAFPSSMQIARALTAAAHLRVPIKFTAGLHHPVRKFHESVQTKMHGFLNVFGAGVLATEHQWDIVQTAAMLDEEDPACFRFTDDTFTWRDWTISTERIQRARRFITSFGSCSFDEPREDLRALDLL